MNSYAPWIQIQPHFLDLLSTMVMTSEHYKLLLISVLQIPEEKICFMFILVYNKLFSLPLQFIAVLNDTLPLFSLTLSFSSNCYVLTLVISEQSGPCFSQNWMKMMIKRQWQSSSSWQGCLRKWFFIPFVSLSPSSERFSDVIGI